MHFWLVACMLKGLSGGHSLHNDLDKTKKANTEKKQHNSPTNKLKKTNNVIMKSFKLTQYAVGQRKTQTNPI